MRRPSRHSGRQPGRTPSAKTQTSAKTLGLQQQQTQRPQTQTERVSTTRPLQKAAPAKAEYNPEPNGADRFFFCFLRFCFFCWEGVRSLCVAASLPTMMLSFVVRFKQPVEIQTPNFLSTKSIGWYARASG